MIDKDYEKALDLLVDKVDGVCDYDWQELCFELGCDMHPDSLRKSFNVGDYSGYQVYKYFTQKYEDETYTDDERFKELIRLKDELYKEKVRYRDVFREHRKDISAEARYDNLVEVMKEAISGLDELPKYDMGSLVKSELNPKHAIIQFSDWHVGAKVDSQFNYYDVDVAQSRVNALVNKVKKYALELNITDAVIEVNGDMIEGLIVLSSKIQSEEDVVSQIAIVSEMLSNAINELKPYFRTLKVVTTLGNHGRLVPDKKSSINKENMEMLIPAFIRFRTKDVPVITSQGTDFVKYEFAGKTIILAHGQNDKGGHILEGYVKLYGCVPDEIHLGHTHGYSDTRCGNTCITVAGTLKGADEYAMNLRENNKASQNLIVYGEDRCVYEMIVE